MTDLEKLVEVLSEIGISFTLVTRDGQTSIYIDDGYYPMATFDEDEKFVSYFAH